MEIDSLLKDAEKYKKDGIITYKTKWCNRFIIIKKEKPNISIFDINKYLLENNFPTYKLINEYFENTNKYLIYEFIEGNDGFHSKRNIDYFYEIGVLIGEMHFLLKIYSKKQLKEEKEIIHNDLHSGNIIESGTKKYIIDFNEIEFNYFFHDLLNIGYEIHFEKESQIKEDAFIDGYTSKMKINYPNKNAVVEEIIKSDKEEYERLIRRKSLDNNYFIQLKKAVVNKKPTFIPKWCI